MEELIRIIEKYAYNKELVKDAKPESRIIADLRINSARIVDIILDIEDDYDIEIEDEALETLITMGDVLKIIEDKT